MFCLNLSDIADITAKGIDYCCILYIITRSEAIQFISNFSKHWFGTRYWILNANLDYSVDISHEPYKVLSIFGLHAKLFKCSTCHNLRTKIDTDNKQITD